MKVVIFDMDCRLCSRFIRLLLRLDKNKKLKFASPASAFATHTSALQGIDFLQSIVFYSDGLIFVKYKAIRKILQEVSVVAAFLISPLNLLPDTIQDRLYDYLATHRYFFGKNFSCSLEDKEVMERMAERSKQ